MWGDTPHTPRFFIYLFFLSIYKTQSTQSLIFSLLFSFDPAEKRGTCRTKENNKHKPYGEKINAYGYHSTYEYSRPSGLGLF